MKSLLLMNSRRYSKTSLTSQTWRILLLGADGKGPSSRSSTNSVEEINDVSSFRRMIYVYILVVPLFHQREPLYFQLVIPGYFYHDFTRNFRVFLLVKLEPKLLVFSPLSSCCSKSCLIVSAEPPWIPLWHIVTQSIITVISNETH